MIRREWAQVSYPGQPSMPCPVCEGEGFFETDRSATILRSTCEVCGGVGEVAHDGAGEVAA